jgi:hypothetical protein
MITVKGYECLSSRGLATELGIGRNNMLKELRKQGILDFNNIPRLKYQTGGYFVCDQANDRSDLVTYYRPNGVALVAEVLHDYIQATHRKQHKKPYKDKSPECFIDLDELLV